MSFLESVAIKAENHLPFGLQIARNYASFYFNEGAEFKGRTVLFGASIVSAVETVTLLALNTLSMIAVGLTSGQFASLNRLSIAFRNNGIENASSSISLLAGSIISPTIPFYLHQDRLSYEEACDSKLIVYEPENQNNEDLLISEGYVKMQKWLSNFDSPYLVEWRKQQDEYQ